MYGLELMLDRTSTTMGTAVRANGGRDCRPSTVLPSRRVWARPDATISHGISIDALSGVYKVEGDPVEVHPELDAQDAAARRSRRRQRTVRRTAPAVELEWDALYPVRRGTALFTHTGPGGVVPPRAMQKFWHWYDKCFDRPYYCKLEAHAVPGEYHYHCIVPDAPRAAKGHSIDALQAEWARCLGDTSNKNALQIDWLDKRVSKRKGVMGYFLSYMKKKGGKAYQEDYSHVPPYIKTVTYRRLRTPRAHLRRALPQGSDLCGALKLAPVGRPRRFPGGWWRVAMACAAQPQVVRDVDLHPVWVDSVPGGGFRLEGIELLVQRDRAPPPDQLAARVVARHQLRRGRSRAGGRPGLASTQLKETPPARAADA